MSDLWLPPSAALPSMPRSRVASQPAERWRELRANETTRMLRAQGARGVRAYERGDVHVIVAREPVNDELRWHLSISARGRYPTWDEVADARYDLLPDELTMAMLLPPRGEYVNLHATTFHLHELRDGEA